MHPANPAALVTMASMLGAFAAIEPPPRMREQIPRKPSKRDPIKRSKRKQAKQARRKNR